MSKNIRKIFFEKLFSGDIISKSQYLRNAVTDLRKAVSGAKFDAESDFEVCLAVAPPKSIKNDEKLIFETYNFLIFFLLIF